jgi:hypothetical protein
MVLEGLAAQVAADGEDSEPSSRIDKHFWPRAIEAFQLSHITTPRRIEARFLSVSGSGSSSSDGGTKSWRRTSKYMPSSVSVIVKPTCSSQVVQRGANV